MLEKSVLHHVGLCIQQLKVLLKGTTQIINICSLLVIKIHPFSVLRFGYGNGKACLLRTICDASSIPFDSKSGLLAEIAHALLT